MTDYTALNEIRDRNCRLMDENAALRAERDAKLLGGIRRWLNEGATIKATDLAKPVLTLLPDGSFDMGVTVTFPDAALAAQEKP